MMLVLLSVANIFDLGMSRAVTNYIASKEYNSKACIVSTLTFLVTLFISLVCLSVFLFCISLIDLAPFARKIAADLESAKTIFFNVIMCIPLIVGFSILRGALEGKERFQKVTFLKIYSSLYTVILLLAGYFFKPDLIYASYALLVSRVLMLLQIFYLSKKEINFTINFNEDILKVVKFGISASVSNFVSAFLVYIDRVFASFMVSPKVFSIYSAILDLITRFTFIPGSISTVMFVTMSSDEKSNHALEVRKGLIWLSLTVVPVSVFFILFGVDFIETWLGSAGANIPDLSDYSFIIFLISIGFLVNSYAHIPHAYLQAKGYVKHTAIAHMLEAIIFIPLMYFSGVHFGIEGLVSAWLLRHVVDLVILSGIMALTWRK